MTRVRKDGLWVTPLVSMAVFIGGVIAGALLDEWVESPVLQPQLKALFIVQVFLVLILLVLGQAWLLLVKLYEKVGIKVRYVDNDASGRVYIACQKVIAKACDSIHVVNSYLLEGHTRVGNDPKKRERMGYYSLLLRKAINEGVSYTRIAQVRRDNVPLPSMQEDDVHFRHLKEMIDNRSPNVTLLKAPANRLTTFVLVDNVHLIWQINKVTFDSGGRERLSLQGAFIIHDPHRRITENFVQYFDTLRSDSVGPVKLVNGRLE